MKKFLFSLVALMAVMTVQAQSICATWRSMQPVVQTQPDGSFSAQNLTLTFNEDGTYYIVDEVTESSQPAPTMALEIAMTVEVRGTYAQEGDQLTLTPDPSTVKGDLLSVSTNGKVTNNPMITAGIKDMLKSDEFKSEFAKTEVYKVVKVTDSTLELADNDQTLTFMRFATIAN